MAADGIGPNVAPTSDNPHSDPRRGLHHASTDVPRPRRGGHRGGRGFAGCLGTSGGSPDAGTDTDDPAAGGGHTPSLDGSERFGGHPGTIAIDAQPYRGPRPGDAAGTIVVFEDPSCPRCAAFERDTVPKIRSELVQPGDATFVFRGYPVIYPWGEPATQALEAAAARHEAAHWALADHYFAEQDAFSTDNVLQRTETFLAGETALDAAAVVEDARREAYGGQVAADLEAGREGGAGGITSTVLLFRDGEYRTKARGSVSFSLVKSALGL